MDLVSAIGERYLWVDSLCLIQDDPADMKNGIDHMDLVYEGAIMTIIAAIGNHINAGLPGLHPGTRKKSPDDGRGPPWDANGYRWRTLLAAQHDQVHEAWLDVS